MTITTSKHFDHSIAIVGVVAVILLGGWLWLKHRLVGETLRLSSNSPTILKKNDKEAISYNSSTHVLTVVTSSGTVKEYSRNPVIHILKDGTVKVDRKLFGLEFSPLLGIGYGDGARMQLGIGWAYVWRFDLNTQLAFSAEPHRVAIIPISTISYNFWRNTSLYVGTDPVKLLLSRVPDIHVGLLVRL